MIKKWAKIVIIVAIISTPMIGTTLFLYFSQKHYENSFHIMREGITVSNIKINNQIKFGELEFQLLSASSENILEVEWTVDYNGIYEKNKFVIIDYKQNNSDLEINIYSGIKIADRNYKQIDLVLNVSINPTYDNYSFISLNELANLKLSVFDIDFNTFEIKSTSGNVDVQINKSVIQNDFIIDSTSGNIDLKLDHITFKNDFKTISLSGDQFFDIWNLKFSSNSNFTASSTTGTIIIRWANHFNKSHN
ncbi:MAG: BF2992 family fimbrillin-A clan protein, partial [Promethearchaeota archaeon]